jgi:arylsulfatase A-like enzyme
MEEAQEETRWVADRTCAFLKERATQPFFLFASFIRPHSPYNPLPRFAELYSDAEVSTPTFDRAEWDQVPTRVRATAESWGWDRLTPDDFREVRRGYYGLCSQIDESIGRILRGLEEAGLADSTIIVFTSDHGDFLGEHGLLFKEHLYEGALHVPLIIGDPRQKRVGLRNSGLVETIDIMPTLLELVELDAPSQMRGKSLKPLMEDPCRPHRSAVFSEWTTHCVNSNARHVLDACVNPNIKSVRTTEWKYIHYVGEPGELYHISDDPGENRNLFDDPACLSVKKHMQELLLNWLIASEELSEPQKDNPYFAQTFSPLG